MSLNVIAYVLYLLITVYIIVVVGQVCYRNGKVFVSELVPQHAGLCLTVNRLLLTGYYLVNIGYCGITLINWKVITSTVDLIATVSFRASVIVLFLAIMHYFNIYIIRTFIHKIIP